MSILLGFDPGGPGNFGWCVAADGQDLPLRILRSGTADHAEDALERALEAAGAGADVAALGVDAPLYWVSNGDRAADKHVRRWICALGARGGTVNSVNSLRGACLVQGMLVALCGRAALGDIPISEAHPKATLWLLGMASKAGPPPGVQLGALTKLFAVPATVGPTDHERDAALAALAAWAMLHRSPGWRDLWPLDAGRVQTPLSLPVGYWVPTL